MRWILLFALFCPSPGFAWNASDHRDMSRHALQDVAADWGLDRPVTVRPLSSFLDKLRPLRPEIADPWQFSHYLQINPKISMDTRSEISSQNVEKLPRWGASGGESGFAPRFEPKHPALPVRGGLDQANPRNEMTPLEILSVYATDPDDGRDQDLFLRDETGGPVVAYRDQKWFGVVQGANSQAFRHIEKPPFNILHPVATFGFPFRRLGEASRRAEIYHQLSLLAFALGEDYWGWRFLAGAFHYLQDLYQPYHAGQVPPSLMKKGVHALLDWGWEAKGFIGTFAHIVANSHRFFEAYVDQPGGKDRGEKESALKALEGKDTGSDPGSFESLAVGIRDASNRVYGRLASAVSRIADPRLDGPYEFKSDEMSQDDPLQFMKEGPEFEAANREIFAIVRERFASAGRVMRTAVRKTLEEKKETQDPKALLSRLDELLGPSPFQQEGAENP